jgi:hypothetical protein
MLDASRNLFNDMINKCHSLRMSFRIFPSLMFFSCSFGLDIFCDLRLGFLAFVLAFGIFSFSSGIICLLGVFSIFRIWSELAAGTFWMRKRASSSRYGYLGERKNPILYHLFKVSHISSNDNRRHRKIQSWHLFKVSHI